MQYTTQQGTQGICPDGWHIPTDDEWGDLVDYLGGSSVAGGKMKETGTTHWTPPNTGATNESGFTALPGGYRDYSSFSFIYLTGSANFWSSSEYGIPGALIRRLTFNSDNVHQGPNYRTSGFSVRCLKD